MYCTKRRWIFAEAHCFMSKKFWGARIAILVITFAATQTLKSQENFTGYLQPSFALSYKLSPRISQNAALNLRTFYFREEVFGLDTRQLDAVLFTQYALSGNQTLSFGIQYRFRNPFETNAGNELRLTQQFNTTLKPATLRFGHRFRSEQRIREVGTIHRFRYRFAVDGPLQGEETDVGEAYWIGSAEPLLSVANGDRPQYDLRLTGWLGWRITANSKVQAGPELRWENVREQTEKILFWQLSWVSNL